MVSPPGERSPDTPAPPLVRRFVLKRFRSIASADLRLENPLYIAGRTGSGKSNLADAFGFMADAMRSPLESVFDMRGGISSVRHKGSGRGGPPNLGMRVELGDDGTSMRVGSFAFEIRAREDHGFEVVEEQCRLVAYDGEEYWYHRTGELASSENAGDLRPAATPTALCLPAVGGDWRFAPVFGALARLRVTSVEPGRLREMQDPDSGGSLRKDGSNAASVLQAVGRSDPDRLGRAMGHLRAVVPGAVDVRPSRHGNKLALEFVQHSEDGHRIRFEAYNMSDGTLRLLGLLVAICQSPAPSVLVIEEPEATLHPGALREVREMLGEAASRSQLVVTTHSPELLEDPRIEDRHLRILVWEHGASRIALPARPARSVVAEHLRGSGALLRADAPEAEPAELFSDSPEPGQLELFESR